MHAAQQEEEGTTNPDSTQVAELEDQVWDPSTPV